MNYEIEEIKDVVLIRIIGSMMGGPEATKLADDFHKLVTEGKKRMIIDLANVDQMNSSGLGILIGGLSKVRNQGGNIKLLHVGKKPKSLLKITKLDCVFEVFEKEDEAIDSYN